jgi:hypothetical protein
VQSGQSCCFYQAADALLHHLTHFGRLACCSTSSLNLFTSPDLCSVLVAPLGVVLLPYSHCQPLLLFIHWEFSSLPHPCVLGQVQHPNSVSAVGVRLQFAVYAFQFRWEVGFQSTQSLHWIMFLGYG